MERQLRRSRAEVFQDKVSKLEPAPVGFEYKRFYGKPVLFPETGSHSIRKGTGLTERQLAVAITLHNLRGTDPHRFDDFVDSIHRRIRACGDLK